jgi:hypothetical protein
MYTVVPIRIFYSKDDARYFKLPLKDVNNYPEVLFDKFKNEVFAIDITTLDTEVVEYIKVEMQQI